MKGRLLWIHLDSQSMPWGCFSANFLTNSERRKFSHYFKLKRCTHQLWSACHRCIRTKNWYSDAHSLCSCPALPHSAYEPVANDRLWAPFHHFQVKPPTFGTLNPFIFSQWSVFSIIIPGCLLKFLTHFIRSTQKIEIHEKMQISLIYGETLTLSMHMEERNDLTGCPSYFSEHTFERPIWGVAYADRPDLRAHIST